MVAGTQVCLISLQHMMRLEPRFIKSLSNARDRQPERTVGLFPLCKAHEGLELEVFSFLPSAWLHEHPALVNFSLTLKRNPFGDYAVSLFTVTLMRS